MSPAFALIGVLGLRLRAWSASDTRGLMLATCVLLAMFARGAAAQTGACCAGTTCQVRTVGGCTLLEGDFLGAGTTCGAQTCIRQACCNIALGACTLEYTVQCTGQPLSATTCTPSPCPVSCCFQNGTCTTTTAAACTGVVVSGVTCGPDTCFVRACCTSSAACVLQSALFGCSGVQTSSTTCTATTCQPFAGSCCRSFGACTTTTAAGCLDGTFTQGQTCGAGVCPVACCKAGGCSFLTPAECAAAGGVSNSSGTCQPFECSGGCCGTTTQACVILNFAQCASLGLRFMGPNMTCGATPCPARGACCTGAACTVTDQSACTGQFLGHGVACAPISRLGVFNACCPADFNAAGGASVQDIFDFLAAWFAGC